MRKRAPAVRCVLAVAAEGRRVWRWPLGVLTVALGALSWLIGPHFYQPTVQMHSSALIFPKNWNSILGFPFPYLLEVGVPFATVVVTLLLENDLVYHRRLLLFSYPVTALQWTLRRLLIALLSTTGWLLLTCLLPGAFGHPLPVLRDVALILPVALCLSGLAFLCSEASAATAVGAGVVGLLILFELPPELPWTKPQPTWLPGLFSASLWPNTASLWQNRGVIAAVGALFWAAGGLAMHVRRKRGWL